MYEEQMENQKK
jgi:peptidoglycan hydrolase CwlO-like protein